MRITIVAYNPRWPEYFSQEQARLASVLRDTGAVIEHIGSTAVPGLAAKPILDLMIGLPDFSIADRQVPRITSLGYEYIARHEQVMPERRFFKREEHGAATHHIHMVGLATSFWERHIRFRDYLRDHPEAASAYAAFKQKLATQDWQDGSAYAQAKTEFIAKIEAASVHTKPYLTS